MEASLTVCWVEWLGDVVWETVREEELMDVLLDTSPPWSVYSGDTIGGKKLSVCSALGLADINLEIEINISPRLAYI